MNHQEEMNHHSLCGIFGIFFGSEGRVTGLYKKRGETVIYWHRAGLPFLMIGSEFKSGIGSVRHFVGQDWTASYRFKVPEIGPLKIRGNVAAAEEAMIHAYLKVL